MFKEDEWKSAYKIESMGKFNIGIEIRVWLPRKLDDQPGGDGITFLKAIDQLTEDLNRRTMELDPQTLINKKHNREDMEKIFENAGLKPIYIKELPNGYCSKACCLDTPWYLVTSTMGEIRIGWRKSVISIEWNGLLDNVEIDGEKVFADQDVTKGKRMVHAWGDAKATEYLKRLHTEVLRTKI